jgi:hypothetical protein
MYPTFQTNEVNLYQYAIQTQPLGKKKPDPTAHISRYLPPLTQKSLQILLTQLLAFAYLLPLSYHIATVDPRPNIAWLLITTLADVFTSKPLESRSHWPVYIVVLSCKFVLPWVAQRIEFVTPVAQEVEPRRWSLWVQRRAAKYVCAMIVCVRVHIEKRIPQWTFVCDVVENAKWKDVGMCARSTVHCMSTDCRVRYRLWLSVIMVETKSGKSSLTRLPYFSTASHE